MKPKGSQGGRDFTVKFVSQPFSSIWHEMLQALVVDDCVQYFITFDERGRIFGWALRARIVFEVVVARHGSVKG